MMPLTRKPSRWWSLSNARADSPSPDQSTARRMSDWTKQAGNLGSGSSIARPMLRGDDVAELQVLLSQLGFNPGRIDGIFGPTTGDALAEV